MWPNRVSNPGLWLMSQTQLLGLQLEIVGSEAQLRGINPKAKTPFGFSECSRVKAVCMQEGGGVAMVGEGEGIQCMGKEIVYLCFL